MDVEIARLHASIDALTSVVGDLKVDLQTLYKRQTDDFKSLVGSQYRSFEDLVKRQDDQVSRLIVRQDDVLKLVMSRQDQHFRWLLGAVVSVVIFLGGLIATKFL